MPEESVDRFSGIDLTVRDRCDQSKRLASVSCKVDILPLDPVYRFCMSTDQRQAWFAKVVESGLEHEVFAPADVLSHATPEVLANHLPAELLGKVLAASLASGSMTPERVLETITPEVLAQHLPHEVLWACIAAAAEKAGVTGAGGGGQ